MLVQLHGTMSWIDTNKVTLFPQWTGGPYSPPTIGAAPGTTSTIYGGEVTAGNLLGAFAGVGVARALWKSNQSNAVLTSWQMDNLNSIQVLNNTIFTALNDTTDPPQAIIVNTDGTLAAS